MKIIFGNLLNKHIFSKYIYHITVFIFLVTFYSCTENADKKNPEEKEREMASKNKIKTIKTFKTNFRIGHPLPEFLVQVRNYNALGMRTDELNYNDSIRVHSLIRYGYDNNGNLVLSTSKGPDSNLIFREERKYNDQDKRTELIFYLPDGTYKYRNISTYDKDGNLLQLAYYWPDGLRGTNKYSYHNGLKIEDTEYNPQGKFMYRWVFSYDKNGNQKEAVQYYPDGIINAKIKSEFNADDLLVSQTTFFGESFKSKFTFEYDNKNLLLVKTEFSSPNMISAKYRYQYEFY